MFELRELRIHLPKQAEDLSNNHDNDHPRDNAQILIDSSAQLKEYHSGNDPSSASAAAPAEVAAAYGRRVRVDSRQDAKEWQKKGVQTTGVAGVAGVAMVPATQQPVAVSAEDGRQVREEAQLSEHAKAMERIARRRNGGSGGAMAITVVRGAAEERAGGAPPGRGGDVVGDDNAVDSDRKLIYEKSAIPEIKMPHPEASIAPQPSSSDNSSVNDSFSVRPSSMLQTLQSIQPTNNDAEKEKEAPKSDKDDFFPIAAVYADRPVFLLCDRCLVYVSGTFHFLCFSRESLEFPWA